MTGADVMLIHVVRRGETLKEIADDYRVDALWLAACNAVSPDGALAVGQTLAIRFPERIHVVQGGETLIEIAARYHLTVRELWRRNWPGGVQRLRVPVYRDGFIGI